MEDETYYEGKAMRDDIYGVKHSDEVSEKFIKSRDDWMKPKLSGHKQFHAVKIKGVYHTVNRWLAPDDLYEWTVLYSRPLTEREALECQFKCGHDAKEYGFFKPTHEKQGDCYWSKWFSGRRS